MQPHFTKTRTHFLYLNDIAKNEERFGVLCFIIFRKQINYP